MSVNFEFWFLWWSHQANWASFEKEIMLVHAALYY